MHEGAGSETLAGMRLVSWLGLALLLSGCGGLRSAVQFDGSRQEPAVSAAQVAEDEALPLGYEALGLAEASCGLRAPLGEVSDEWLSQIDCSEDLLVRALRERAAEIGAELIVARTCTSRDSSVDASIARYECRATFARPDAELRARRAAGTAGPAAGRAAAYPADEPPATESWRIRVSFDPAGAPSERAATRAADVRDVENLPPNDRAFGAVVARCDAGCTERGARAALRAVSARAGANDVVGASCVARGAGWLCTATAAGYQHDPRTQAAAR